MVHGVLSYRPLKQMDNDNITKYDQTHGFDPVLTLGLLNQKVNLLIAVQTNCEVFNSKATPSKTHQIQKMTQSKTNPLKLPQIELCDF